MKFISSLYDGAKGFSSVVMEHLGVNFIGTARLHPDDAHKASEYAGCAYAETRATIAALKYERNKLKEEAEMCRKFIKACECYKGWDPESPSARAAYRQLNRRIKKVNDITDEINDRTFNLERHIWKRDITLKALDRNKQNRLKDNPEN